MLCKCRVHKKRNAPQSPTQVIKRKLESPITLPVYGDKRACVTSTGSTMKEQLLRAGDCMPLYIGQAPDEKLPKDATAGACLCMCVIAVCVLLFERVCCFKCLGVHVPVCLFVVLLGGACAQKKAHRKRHRGALQLLMCSCLEVRGWCASIRVLMCNVTISV